jgi:hypothetical protein
VHVFVVEGLDVERGQESFDEPGGGVGEDVSEDGQFVQEGGVAVVGVGGGEFG